MIYIGFFITPVALLRVQTLRPTATKRLVLSGLAVALVVLSITTFLVYNSNVASGMYTSGDVASGVFIAQESLGTPQVYGVTNTFPYVQYYLLPNRPIIDMGDTLVPSAIFDRSNLSSMFDSEAGVVAEFQSSPTQNSVLLYSSYQWDSPFYAFFGGLDPPQAQRLVALTGNFSRVLDTGGDQLFVR